MFVRLTHLQILPEHEKEATKIYNEQVVPVVKQQKGNVDIMLLHPETETGDHISLTSWERKEDADAYEQSGKYQELVSMVKHTFSKAPTLVSYTVN
jgi:heme-degrading monooxygenase HmoA